MKVEKVLVSLVVICFPDLNVRVNLNILICFVCYISAQVADFMSSVGNRLIGGKSTVAVVNFIAIGFVFVSSVTTQQFNEYTTDQYPQPVVQ